MLTFGRKSVRNNPWIFLTNKLPKIILKITTIFLKKLKVFLAMPSSVATYMY